MTGHEIESAHSAEMRGAGSTFDRRAARIALRQAHETADSVWGMHAYDGNQDSLQDEWRDFNVERGPADPRIESLNEIIYTAVDDGTPESLAEGLIAEALRTHLLNGDDISEEEPVTLTTVREWLENAKTIKRTDLPYTPVFDQSRISDLFPEITSSSDLHQVA